MSLWLPCGLLGFAEPITATATVNRLALGTMSTALMVMAYTHITV
jgi:hypothetical protein